ncbi:MAG: protein kinase [Bryobacteraceae bacterium]|nr:protein kinase [Bryobacteraceae bacterium]
MAHSAGDQLGPYEILAPLGAGGMGEVYKARDTRLERTVAVKVLPEHIAKREDVRVRFEREARAVASLNHPHICTLHDIGPGYMVMELIEGETLASRIAKGALPLDQALKYAAQIADALDRAHRAGVTHRDVKPQNIMLTRDGVKVLDFGLAKSTVSKPGPTEETLTKALTAEGTVMGTPQYMAPEQFGGKEADARSDIWAFGAVLYEMVTGRKAFAGSNYQSLVGAILATDPAPLAVQPFTPAWLERLVRRCLAKEAEDRWQSMRDIVLELRSPPVEAVAAKASRWPWVAAAAGIALGVAGWLLPWRTETPPGPPVQLDLSMPSGFRLGGLTANTYGEAISPDGQTVAFVATDRKGETMLYIRRLDATEATAVPGTENAARPFWSPDSRTIGFTGSGKLKRVEVLGGTPVSLCDAPAPRGASWSENDVILFADETRGLLKVPAAGGPPARATAVDAASGEIAHTAPQFLPGGAEFLFHVRHQERQREGIYWGALDGLPKVLVQATATPGIFDAASGRLLYLLDSRALVARRLALNPPRTSGDPVILAEGVSASVVTSHARFSLSRTGTLIYVRAGSRAGRLGWRDRAGKLLESFGPDLQDVSSISLSPDGRQVAYSTGSAFPEVWVMTANTGTATRITQNGGNYPRWSADGKWLFYANRVGLQRRAADGSGQEETLWEGNGSHVTSVSPDSRNLLFGNGDIYRLPLEGVRKPLPFVQTSFSEYGGVFSPDGRWVAYHSEESGRREVYIRAFPGGGNKVRVSAAGGNFPAWRADGKELYWRSLNNDLVAAAITLNDASANCGPVQKLAGAIFLGSPQPAPDGQRFLDIVPEAGQQEATPLVVMLNWIARLKKGGAGE